MGECLRTLRPETSLCAAARAGHTRSVLERPLRLRRATPVDAAEIVRLRHAMFASMGFADGDQRWLEAGERHFEAALAGSEVVGVVVECGDSRLASCGVIELQQRILSPFNVTGTYAYISSMSTDAV